MLHATERGLCHLENFTSLAGPAFYRREANDRRITLTRHPQPVPYPASIRTAEGPLTVFDPGFPLYWHVKD